MTDPSLPRALVDLASVAGDQPLALTGIEERARRVRVRRGAGRVDPTGLPAGTSVGFSATRTGATTCRLNQLNM